MNIFKSKIELPLIEANAKKRTKFSSPANAKKRTKFSSPLKLIKGTRFVSFLFIGSSALIAAGILFAANIYFNIDTGEVVVREVQRMTGVLRAVGGLVVGGTDIQDPALGYTFEVVGDARLANNVTVDGKLRFQGGDTFAGFQAPDLYGTTTPITYMFPQHGFHPPTTDYVLTWQAGNQLMWREVHGVAGVGDITAVGDCPAGDCFTVDGAGNAIWFEGTIADAHEIQLVAANPSADHTITLPAATGTVALGTGTLGHVAYWTGANTLAGEAHLSPIRGGTGADSSAWNGMVNIVGGTWGTTTGVAGHAAFWSDAHTIGHEPHLTVARGGTGAGTFTSRGILFGAGIGPIGATPAGATNQLLRSGGGTVDPSWANIADLVTATNGLTETGTTDLTIRLGGALTEHTTITQGNHDMIFNLTGTGDFRVRDAGVDLFTVTHDGRILFKTYPLAYTGKQVLREMIPILGFDLPAQTATTSYVAISRTIEAYSFSPARAGATRIHKFVIRYADATTTAPTNWRVWNVTAATTTASFNVPATPGTDIGAGKAHITPPVAIPTGTDDWRLELMTPGTAIRVFQIFLAAYDELL